MRHSSFFSLPALLAGLFVVLSGPAMAEQPKPSGEEPPAEAEKAAPEKKKPAQPEAKKPEAEKKPTEAKKPGKKRGDVAARKEKPDEEAPAKGEDEAEDGEEKKEAKLTGIVEAKKQTAVAMHLDRWTDLTVVSVVPHGTSVKKGDLLLELETKPLEKKIRELKAGMPLKELDLQTAKQD